MSDSQTQSYKPTKTAMRNTSVWVWAVALLLAVGLLGAAVVWAGGVQEVGKMLGIDRISLPSLPWFNTSGYGGSAGKGPSQAQTTVTTVTAPATGSAPTTSALSPDALSRMFIAQVDSRLELTDLVEGDIGSLSLGLPQTSADSSKIPVTAAYAGGVTHRGVISLMRYSGTWYLFGFETIPSTQSGSEAAPRTINSDVVKVIAEQQAEAGTQSLIVDGILDGGFKVATIDTVQAGPRTATVDMTLSGGTSPSTKARLVCVSEDDLGTTYWFVARFEKR